MTYPTIELFSKMVKNTKHLRQKEMRLSTEQAVDLLSEIAQLMSTKPTNQETKEPKSMTVNFDAGGF
jgi:hypothetical protein